MVLLDQTSPLSISTELLNWHEIEIAKWTRIKIRVHGLINFLVAPFAPVVTQQIANDPTLRLLNWLSVFQEGPFPNGPQHTAEDTASIAMSKARRFNYRAVFLRAFPVLCVVGNQFSPLDSGDVQPTHDVTPLVECCSVTLNKRVSGLLQSEVTVFTAAEVFIGLLEVF